MSGGDDIDPTASASGTASVEGAGESAAAMPIEATAADVAIAEALAAGRIDAAAARELILSEVLAEQLAKASAQTRARVAAELRLLVADDPALERLLGSRRPA